MSEGLLKGGVIRTTAPIGPALSAGFAAVIGVASHTAQRGQTVGQLTQSVRKQVFVYVDGVSVNQSNTCRH